MIRILLTAALLPAAILGTALQCSKNVMPFETEIVLGSGWLVGPDSGSGLDGAVLSAVGTGQGEPDLLHSMQDLEDWSETPVPSTVLAALVRCGLFSDPYFGTNLSRIPSEPFESPWWYVNRFSVKDADAARFSSLVFEGINYRADVWLNGSRLAHADTLAGAFRIFELDITGRLREEGNTLAVRVHPPEPGDFTVGFVDWNPRPPDGNMGLWRRVLLRRSGPLSLRHPFVSTRLSGPESGPAEIVLKMDVRNHQAQRVRAELAGEVDGKRFTHSFSLEPNGRRTLRLTPAEVPELLMDNPRLWWPHTLGEPNLYRLDLTLRADGRLSDRKAVTFGIREVSDYITESGHRGYKINGRPLLILGGGWVDDLMLNEDGEKLEDQFRYAVHMNLNTIRLEGFWGCSPLLYDLADRYGILLMAGWSCQWEWQDYLGKPVDQFGGIESEAEIELAVQYLRDQVKWLRNHPSIFLWVLGSDKLPRPELERRYLKCLAGIDTTRPVLAACATLFSEVSGPTAVKMNGPYDYVTPNYWYLDRERGGAFGFNTETGPGPQPPPFSSLKRMIPEHNLWPIDSVWNYHCGRNEFNTLDRYLTAFNARYGAAVSAQDLALRAQAANYEAMRAMFEAFAVNRPAATGVIQWMFNSAWPEMFWQLYDWYLMPNGAFYGARIACRPVHLIYHYGDSGIYAVSDRFEALSGLAAEIRVYDYDSGEIFYDLARFDLLPAGSTRIAQLSGLQPQSTVYFVDLTLKSEQDSVLERSLYWLSTQKDEPDFDNSTWFYTPNSGYADLTPLRDLPPADVKLAARLDRSGPEWQVRVDLDNDSQRLAFFYEMTVVDSRSGQPLVPIFWDDNCISLRPGEQRSLSARFRAPVADAAPPQLRWSSYSGGSGTISF